jgi:hypothetical protein
VADNLGLLFSEGVASYLLVTDFLDSSSDSQSVATLLRGSVGIWELIMAAM